MKLCGQIWLTPPVTRSIFTEQEENNVLFVCLKGLVDSLCARATDKRARIAFIHSHLIQPLVYLAVFLITSNNKCCKIVAATMASHWLCYQASVPLLMIVFYCSVMHVNISACHLQVDPCGTHSFIQALCLVPLLNNTSYQEVYIVYTNGVMQ
jgi:hypothetical protein